MPSLARLRELLRPSAVHPAVLPALLVELMLLHLSETTVKTHVTHVLQKLRLRDRVQLVVWSYETGFVRPGDLPLLPDPPAALRLPPGPSTTEGRLQ